MQEEDDVIRQTEANEDFQKIVTERYVIEVDERIRNDLVAFEKLLGWDEERMENFEEGNRGMVKKKKRGKAPGEAGQEQGERVQLGENKARRNNT